MVGEAFKAFLWLVGSKGLYKIIRWALMSLGVGVAAYFISDSIVASIFQYVLSQFNGMPSDLVQLAGIFGVDVMMNYFLAYLSLLVIYKSMSKVMGRGLV